MNNAPLGAGLPRSRFPGRPADLVRLTSLCALMFSANAAWSAEGGSLRLERNSSGSIIQAIAIDEWRFDAATGRLTVDTKDGNRRCGYAPAAKAGAQTLVLDGFEYPIERFHISGKKAELLSVTPVIAGDIFPLCTTPVPRPQLVSAFTTKGPTGLNVEFDVLGQAPAVLGVTGGIDYAVFGSPATISLALAENVMCLQSGAQGGVQLTVTDTNGVATDFQGFAGLAYQPFGGSGSSQPTLRATTDGNPVCLALPSTAQTVSPGSAPGVCSQPDAFFRDGFEVGGSPIGGAASTDLEVDLQLVENPNTTTGQNAIYDLVVTNCGENAASNVVLRDLYPRGAARPARLGAGSWNCADQSCSGSGYVNAQLGTLEVGSSASVRVERPLNAGGPGDIIQISAAVAELDSNGENDPLDNVASWQFDVRDNNLPELDSSGSCAIDEDSGTADILANGCNGGEGFTVTGLDTDGTIVDVAATSLTPGVISVSGSPTFTGGGSASVNVTGLVINTQPDANGTGTIRITATDNLGGEGSIDLDVTVNAVNDPPSVTVRGGFDYNDGNPTFSSSDCTESACAAQNYPSSVGQNGELVILSGWVVSTSAGPTNETEPAPTPVVSDVSGANLFSGGGQPRLNANGSAWDLIYNIDDGVSGTATVTVLVDDGQAVNNTATLVFEVSVNNAPPTVSITGAPENILEDVADQELTGLTVAATDLEGDNISVSAAAIGPNAGIIDAVVVDDSNPSDVRISVTPAADAFGMVDFEVIASDGSPSAPQIFTLTVDNVNDPPQVVFADAATITADNNVLGFQLDPPGLLLDRTITSSSAILPFLVIEGDEALGSLEGGVQTIVATSITVTSDPSGIFDDEPTFDEFQPERLNFRLSGNEGVATAEITVTDSGTGNNTSAPVILNIQASDP